MTDTSTFSRTLVFRALSAFVFVLTFVPVVAIAQPPDEEFPQDDPLDEPQEDPPPPEEPPPEEALPPIEETPPEFEEELEVETFDRLDTEPRDGAARARLVAGQTAHGIILGVQTCIIMDCQTPPPTIALPVAGGGLGLGLSLWATHSTGIHRGHADAINSGTLWGGWGGLAASTIADRSVAPSMIVGQLAGLGAGHLLARLLRPTSGDVLTVNTGGVWATAYYLLISEGLLERSLDTPQLVTELAVTTVAGGIAGGVTTGLHPVSASRIGAINAAGVLMGAVGAGIPMIFFDDPSRQAVAASALGGATVGLGTSTYFSARWDEEEFQASTPSWFVVPATEGVGAQFTLSGQW